MCFFKKSAMPKPNGLVDITSEDIAPILKTSCPNANIYLSDSYYSTVSIGELRRFLADDKTNEYRYVSEFYDCDDFSFRLMGQIHSVEWGALPFGIMWTQIPGGNHAVNCFIDCDKKLWIVEPQNDSVYFLPNDWSPYLVIL